MVTPHQLGLSQNHPLEEGDKLGSLQELCGPLSELLSKHSFSQIVGLTHGGQVEESPRRGRSQRAKMVQEPVPCPGKAKEGHWSRRTSQLVTIKSSWSLVKTSMMLPLQSKFAFFGHKLIDLNKVGKPPVIPMILGKSHLKLSTFSCSFV